MDDLIASVLLTCSVAETALIGAMDPLEERQDYFQRYGYRAGWLDGAEQTDSRRLAFQRARWSFTHPVYNRLLESDYQVWLAGYRAGLSACREALGPQHAPTGG